MLENDNMLYFIKTLFLYIDEGTKLKIIKKK